MGKGGNIITLASYLYASDNLPYLLDKMEKQAPHVRPTDFSFPQQASEPSFERLEVRELNHPALLRYLSERNIDLCIARKECVELHFSHNGKNYFAIGFKNKSGGYEVRNRFFKGCMSPKDITHIRQQGERTVNFHLNQVTNKTDSRNRNQAIAKSISSGIIVPSLDDVTITNLRLS
jgi:hypothetical protein